VASVEQAVALGADTGVVLTPPSSHRHVVEVLTGHGLDVVIDKPLAANLPEATELVECVERAGVRAAVTFQHRYSSATRVAREAMRQRRIGELRAATVIVPLWRSDDYYREPGRGTLSRDGGGVLITQAIHPLDSYLALVGPPRSVVSTRSTSRSRLEAEDTIHLLVEHENCAASIMASTAAWPGGPAEIHLYGDGGQLHIVGESVTLAAERTEVLVSGAVDASGPDPRSMSAWFIDLYTDVFGSWARRQESGCEARSGLAVQALIDAAYRSAGAPLAPVAVQRTTIERQTCRC
jgi:predicted dehydrogenase